MPADPRDEMEPLLEALLSSARAAWPGVQVPDEEFARHLLRHVPAGADVAGYISSLYIEDLYLACACALRIEPALREFERRFLAPLSELLPRDGSPDHIDEVRQVLREKLLVGETKIAEYAGRGSLLSWVRTAALRAKLDLHRKENGPHLDGDDDAALRRLAAAQDPELDFIRGRYRQEFAAAFEAALAALPVQQRNVLRLRYVDGLNLEGAGAVLGVSRATANRWLVEAREEVLRGTRRELHQRLQLSPTEFDSLVGLLRSQLDMSIARLLRS